MGNKIKALPFLELDLSYDTFRHRYINGNELIPEKEILNEYIIWFDTLKEFYSQPFKPEMITELFEGWEGYDGHYYYKKQAIFDFGYTNYEIKSNINWKIPRTLNDFISDCNRAGIELNWKPEIIKQYFQ